MRLRPGANSALSALLLAAVIAPLASRPGAATLANDEKAIVHVLNRIGFGPRRSDVARIQRIGLRQYIDRQLHPERVPNRGMTVRLAGLQTVGLSQRDIAEDYERPILEARRARRQQQRSAADEPEMIRRPQNVPLGQQRASILVVELAEQKLRRAVYSERQLEEVLADFDL